MSLFLLTFIIPILMLLIDIRTPHPIPLLYLSLTPLSFALPSTFDFFSQSFFLCSSKIYSAQYFKHFLLYSFFLLPLCFLSEFSEPRRREPDLSECFFVCHTSVQFFSVCRIIYDSSFIYLLYVCHLVYIGTGLVCFVFVCVCVRVRVHIYFPKFKIKNKNLFIRVCTCIYVFMYVYVCMILLCVYMCVCVYVCMFVCVCMYVCMYVYMYLRTYV